MNSNAPRKFHIDTPNDVIFASQSYIFQPGYPIVFAISSSSFSWFFRSFLRFTCRFLSQDVDDVEMFERRINAMLTIGIKKEDLTQVPPKSDLEGARGAR